MTISNTQTERAAQLETVGNKTPLRITYLHQYFVPPNGPGGTRSYEFARRLIASGHHVQMITSTAMMPEPYKSLTRATKLEVAGIPAAVVPLNYGNEMGFTDRMKAFMRFAALASFEAIRQPADVIFATSTPLTIAVPGMLARLRHRVPMVFEVRDLWPELPIAIGALHNPFLKFLASGLEWLAYHSSAQVVALSPGMAEGVIKRGIPADRVTVIPNSCDVELFDVPASRGKAIRNRLPGLCDDQPLVVYTGTFGKINGVGYMVEIAAAMRSIAPEVRFLLVGSGAEQEQVMARARVLGVLDQNLWIWDPIPKAEMPDLLAAATVATSLFIPLRPMWNNSANKFFDALAAGKPIAINYGGWQAELLERYGAGIALPSASPADAARMLAAFVRDPQRLQQATAASRRLAHTQFHRDLMAQQLEAVLQRAVSHQERDRLAVH